MTVIAADYERVSTMVQAAQGYSLGAQRQDAASFAQQQGWALLPDLHFRDGVDQDTSGADWDLPALNAMLDAARAHRFTVLIVPSHDRLARDQVKAMVIEAELATLGVRVQYLDAPPLSAEQSAEAELLNGVSHAFSQYDRAKRRRSSMRGRRAKAEMGRWVGNGLIPFGYLPIRTGTDMATGKQGRIIGLRINEAEASIVRALFDRARHMSGAKILRWLDQSVIPSPGHSRGRKGADLVWHHSTLYSVLTNRLYTGKGTYAGNPIEVPAIIGEDLFDDVERAMASRAHRPSGHRRDEDDEYLLRGRLVCGVCSKPGNEQLLRTEAMAGGMRRYYVCPNRFESRIDRLFALDRRCTTPTLRADLAEEIAWLLLAEALTNTARLDSSLLESQQQRDAELSKLDGRLAAFDAQIKLTSRKLDRAVVRLTELEPDDEEIAVLEKTRDEAKGLLSRLRDEHARTVASTRAAGMSAEEVASLREYLTDMGDLDQATREDKRALLERLNVRAEVYPIEGESAGEDDVLVQVKPKRHARLEWTADIRLGSGRSLLKLRVLLRRSGMVVRDIERIAA
jgi:site-specific DNA recombinase